MILTPREYEVACLRSTDMLPVQIADELHITENTVINHLKSIYSKLNIHSAISLTRWCIYNIELKEVSKYAFIILMCMHFTIESYGVNFYRRVRTVRSGRKEYITLLKLTTNECSVA